MLYIFLFFLYFAYIFFYFIFFEFFWLGGGLFIEPPILFFVRGDATPEEITSTQED